MRLGHVTGAVEPAEVFGGFGPVSGLDIPIGLWRGACIGGCGGRPYVAAEYPSPECVDCMRHRHGVDLVESGVPIGTWRPIVAPERWSWRPWNRPEVDPPTSPSKPAPQVLRRAVEVSHDDASLPSAVRGLLKLAPAATVTAAVAARDGALVASLAVHVSSVGYAVYTRGEDGAWGFANAVLADPQLRPVGARAFAAALAGVEYVPPAPREPIRGCCVACRAEVSITADGRIYASHKCKTTKVEGRS